MGAWHRQNFRCFLSVIILSFIFIGTTFGAVPVPEKLQALQATYQKITIKWEIGDGDETVSSYKIFRDNVQIGTSTDAQYTDTGLNPGTVYVYKVVAVSIGGNESDNSDTCSIKTIASVPFDGSASVESVVDSMNPGASTNNTATMLLGAVQSGFEALFSTSITYTVIDGDLLSNFITEELNVINGAAEDMTAAERLAVQQELDVFLSENYGGNSFEHVYINSKLTELAEKHYFNGRKIAANELYELSLKYLSDQEHVVSNSLHRMAYFKVAELTADSTVAETASAVAAYKNTALRFFEFFPGAINSNAENIYYRVMQEHFKRFSVLLTYDNYQTQSYQDAAAMATALLGLNNSTLNQDRVARVTAWELVPLTVNFSDSNGNPASGLLTVSNVTAESDRKNVFYNSAEAEVEERTFAITNGSATIGVYSGHIYNLTVRLDVTGGNPIVYTINDLPHTAGTLLSCDHYAAPVVSELPSGTSGAQMNMIFNRPNFPYNLAWTQHADVFNLSWDWVDSDNFAIDHFVVYRGDTAIGTVTEQQLNGIPYENTAGVYTYKVVAYDASGNASPDSQIVTITLPDMSAYSAYMAWREFYFGDNPQYASDDSDADGVDNYTEFLLGTDPTRILGTQWVEAGQVAYSKATIKWDKVFAENANVTYTIYRNGEAVGTSNSEIFTDSGLTPGVFYTYTVSAVNDDTGVETEPGMALSLRTGAVVEFANSDKVRQVVDSLTPVNINEHTATTLIAAVKSGFEAVFGTSIAFTVVNEDILQDFVAAELELLGTEEDALTNAEKLAARTELRDFLDQHYNGNSFEHMYINAKLAELAETHYQKGNTTAALELFEASLFYLKDCENIVSGTLSRLARIKLDAINDNSTNAEIIAALDASRDQYLRFFNYFAESSTNQALFSYTRPASEYFKYFPRLLTYDNYSTSVFTSANDLAQSALEIDSSALIQARADNIAAWELGSIKVDFSDSTDELLSGTLTVKNSSEHAMIWNYNENIPLDRVYSLAECPLTIPVYLGHKYDLKLSSEISGGNALEWTYANIPLTPGRAMLFNNYAQAETALLSDPSAGAELKFIMDKPDYPYNLSAAIIADAFDLSWDWSDTATLNAVGYKVYRGGTEFADVTNKALSGIAIENEANAYNYTVKAYDVLGNLSASSQELIVMPPAITPQLAAYYAWKQKYFGTNPSFSNEDPDGDGLTNWQEFLLDSNPTVTPATDPKAGLTQMQPGLLVNYYSGNYSVLPDFSRLTSLFKTEVLSVFSFSTNSNILNSGLSSELAMTMEGYLDVPQGGLYRFYLSSADGSKLYINGYEVVDNNRTHSVKEFRNSIVLHEGPNVIKIEYFNRTTNPATLKVDWSGPGFDRTDISSSVWYTGEDNAGFKEFIAWRKDSDGDGLTNYEEIHIYGTDPNSTDSDGDGLTDYDEISTYKTNPLNADTDGDGVSDYEEVFMSNSNPLIPDMDLSDVETVLTLNGADYSSCIGAWNRILATQIYAGDRRGSLSYQVNIPQDYTYRLKLNVKEFYPLTRQANLKLYVDDVFVGERKVSLDNTAYQDVFFFLPWLKSGNHTITVQWDNYRSASALWLNTLELQKIGGPDANENGVADWIEDGMNKVCSATEITASRVSPAFLEGSAQYPDLVAIEGTIVRHGAGNKWYADVPLNNSGSTPVLVSFQNGGKVTARSVSWTQTNIIQESGAALTIRTGDSLLLKAFPAGANDGQYVITRNSESYSGSIADGQILNFNEAGEFNVSAEFTGSNGATASGNITVKVVGYAFNDVEPACWAMRTRSWDIPELPEGVVLEADNRLDNFENSSVVLNGLKRYDVTIDTNLDRYAVVRLGENGPVLAQKKLKGFSIISSNMTYVRQVDEFEDGTILYEMLIISTPVMPDVALRLNIFVSGVIFDDGSVAKEITASDFDATGQCKVYFLYSPEAKTSTCHNLKAYQDGTYIGIRY